MKFDRYDEGFDDIPDFNERPSEKPKADDGLYRCVVANVREFESSCLVTMDFLDGEYEPIKMWLSPNKEHEHRNAKRLLRACGLAEDADVDDSIVGMSVMVAVNPKKKENYWVNGIRAIDGEPKTKPAAPAPAAKKPAARTPAQKIARDAGQDPGGNDDIPF